MTGRVGSTARVSSPQRTCVSVCGGPPPDHTDARIEATGPTQSDTHVRRGPHGEPLFRTRAPSTPRQGVRAAGV
jgi:hypothetical protein